MSEPSTLNAELASLIGEEVVLDVKASYVYIGTLRNVGGDALVLDNADAHSCEDSTTTRELYVLETRKNGIRPNRRVVHVMRSQIVSISRLSDIVLY